MNDWFDMGGYELYVWGSMALSLAVFVWNVLAPALRRRSVLQQPVDTDESDQPDGGA